MDTNEKQIVSIGQPLTRTQGHESFNTFTYYDEIYSVIPNYVQYDPKNRELKIP